jgi:hypothetical protein
MESKAKEYWEKAKRPKSEPIRLVILMHAGSGTRSPHNGGRWRFRPSGMDGE